MKIFSDRHHAGLAFSLYLLLEKRLKHEIFFPIGMTWFPEYWRIAAPYGDNIDTAKQYLDLSAVYVPKDGTPPLNKVVAQDGYYDVEDSAHGYISKAVTLEQFKSQKFDILIASIPEHVEVYTKLRDLYQPSAKVILQIGNIQWDKLEILKTGLVKNLMASVLPFDPPVNNKVFYHQEIDRTVFDKKPTEPLFTSKELPKISSFVIGLPDEQVFFNFKAELEQDFDFTAYASTYTPFLSTIKELANSMANSMWIFNHKPRGDGFGHILYDTAFIGRPLIIDFRDYADKLGAELLSDGMTAVDLNSGSQKYVVDKIRQLSTPRNISAMSMNIYNRVCNLVNYEKEGEKIQAFLERLQ